MKVYKETAHLSTNSSTDKDASIFYKNLNDCIKQMQEKGYELEIQYNTCASDYILFRNVLILAYTEE